MPDPLCGREALGSWPGPLSGACLTIPMMRLTAAISKDGEWYVAQCLEVDIASQGHTLDEARDNLAEALALHFEDEDVHIGEPPVIVPIDIAV
jgi:predicted RNase H-like HicB family nuclease